MPPKKKQEEIDLSTLPECKSLNLFLYARGKKERAKKLLSKIDNKFDKIIFHVKKAAVLDHAKEKGIYIDPDSLTDKQKKDPKFMETVCTQLTPKVLGKATQSYINNQNVKIRLEKKVLLEKPESAQIQKNKKIDCIYIFDDFPTLSQDFEGLAAINQAIKFVLVYKPNITWASAPEEPDQNENPDEQPNQLDEDYQNYKKLKEAEQLSPDDQGHQKEIQEKLHKIKSERRKSDRSSLFRNCVIEEIKWAFDPYNQEASLDQAVNLLLPTCEQLLLNSNEFKTWVSQRKTQKLLSEEASKTSITLRKEQQNKDYVDKTISVISNLINSFKKEKKDRSNEVDDIDFQTFDFDAIDQEPTNNISSSQKIIQSHNDYIAYNQSKTVEERNHIQALLSNMKYPGIDRHMLPQIPLKSDGVRKNYRSSFGPFLPEGMSFHDFERKMNILFLQNAAKQVDQERFYDFGNRIYEQQHNKQSLLRQLNRAFLYDESTLAAKYNQNNDKLYLCFLYKNPARRMAKKVWDCNWKVLPNFENWLKYFKENESNLNNSTFYDIDYQSIGNLQEEANVWSVDSGVIVRKKMSIAGSTTQLLYALPGDNTGGLAFGIRSRKNQPQFYSKNEIASLSLTTVNSKKSIFMTFADNQILQFKENGDILIRKPQQRPRLITRHGYTIIYEENNRRVLHPNGGVSQPPNRYINILGKGLQNKKLYQTPTLRRVTEQGQIVVRRDDDTVIVEQAQRKWIKFSDNTEYLQSDKVITIEKKSFPTVKIFENGDLLVTYNGAHIFSKKQGDSYVYQFTFSRICSNNKSKISFFKDRVEVLDGKSDTPYICQLINNPSISKSWPGQSISVEFDKSKYVRGSKQLDPEESEENFNEQDVIRADYLEPRLFIINNDSTGIELLSHKQIQKSYLEIFKGKNGESLEQIMQRNQLKQLQILNESKSIIQGVAIIPQSKQLNKSAIKKPQINLDIFKNTEQKQIHQSNERIMQVRSLIRNKQVTGQDRRILNEIVCKKNQSQAKRQREENQYGHKQKNDPGTLQRFEIKKKIIQFRKIQQQKVISEKLKEEAIRIYDKETEAKLKKLQSLNKEAQMRKRLSKKKSYVSLYNWKEPAVVEVDQNEQYYNAKSKFYTNYFQTVQGQKALAQMPQWVFRPKQKKSSQQLDPQIKSQLMNRTRKQQDLMNNTNQKQSIKEQSERNERYDTVEPDLRPSPVIYIKPSVFTQKQIDEERFAFESQKKAYDYHERKRKDFDVYGRDRKQKPEVPSLLRTQPISQLNQKYLVTEAPVDKKVKISSMKNKLTSSASNMTEMRKEGPHANLIKSIDKGNDYNRLLEKRTMMVQADLNDRLQRDIQINPIEANFGMVKQGGNYQMKIEIKNEDILAQRIQLKKPKSIFCRVQMKQMGPIALGMTRKVIVVLKASQQILGKFNDQFQIVTKHQIYRIPILAHILSKNQFENSGTQLFKSVREFEQIGKKKRQELPPIKGAQ